MSTLAEIKANTTWIQGFGACAGKPAGALEVGDVLGWNGGGSSTVTEIMRQTAQTITIEMEWKEPNQRIYRGERIFKKSRIIATIENGKYRVANVTKAELAIVR